ncbi:MAG: hypothetical protein U9P11_10315 [Pseudomonadota bacterium]|nr:hypothetical protein [Pseudomonadota bacterium]
MSDHTQSVEIVLHVNDTLGEDRRNDLVTSLAANDGVYNACFTPNREHLMRVKYNRIQYKAQDILRKVMSQHVHAELIGPI